MGQWSVQTLCFHRATQQPLDNTEIQKPRVKLNERQLFPPTRRLLFCLEEVSDSCNLARPKAWSFMRLWARRAALSSLHRGEEEERKKTRSCMNAQQLQKQTMNNLAQEGYCNTPALLEGGNFSAQRVT